MDEGVCAYGCSINLKVEWKCGWNGWIKCTTHILCLIPFLANRLPRRFSDVLATVNDTPRFKLSSLTNTSAAYADTLAALSTKLTYDPAARQQCVDELGIKGWRKWRLMLEFEAALVRRGWLER
ncbi:hypothetical protein P692DRAFT_201901006 [Suillus brevipes Sb2]|nr:hypothetical protein P692DRAFT_201901006 [Suillus brevipes Sb2]